MTFRFNVAANYVGQAYSGLVGVAVTPVYLAILGAEAYGLIGVFALLQVWLQLLDMGLGAAMMRETARYHAGGIDALSLRRLLRSLEWIFWSVAIAISATLALLSPWIARHWLQASGLTSTQVEYAVTAMAFAVGARWVGGLYRSVIAGLEQQVRLNVLQSTVATLRFIAVIPLLYMTTSPIIAFFVFQIAVSLIEVGLLFRMARLLLSKGSTVRIPMFPAWEPVRKQLAFAGTLSLASFVWIAVTQVDKLILSHQLPLDDYGRFSAAVMLTGAITMFSVAVSQALLPGMTRALNESGADSSLQLYRSATQFTSLLVGSLAITLGLCAEDVLWIWFGDRAAAADFAPVLALYAAGNALMALASYSYCMQYAQGQLRMHLIGNMIFAVTLVPAMAIATSAAGALGAAWVWLAVSALFFFVWVPLVHARFAPGLHLKWMANDILLPLAGPVVVGLAIWHFGSSGSTRPEAIVHVLLTYMAMALAGAWPLLHVMRQAQSLRRTSN